MCVCVFVCLVTHSCSMLHDPMDCSPSDPFVHGILQARILEGLAIPFSKGWIFMTQRSNLGLLYCRQIPYHRSHQGRPMNSSSSQMFTNRAPLILVTIQKFISYNWMSTLTFVVVYFSFFDRKVLLR